MYALQRYGTSLSFPTKIIHLGDTMPPTFCDTTGIFNDYYGMATAHKSLKYNPLTTHNDS